MKAAVLTAVTFALSFFALLGLWKIFCKFYSLRFMTSNSDYAEIMVCTADTVPLSELKRGQFILFTYHGKPYPQYKLYDGTAVIKQIWGFPGDELVADGRHVYINGQLRAIALHQDSKGRPVHPFVYKGKIPPHEIFVLAPHPLSFDSRYYGFVPVSWGIHKCWKVF